MSTDVKTSDLMHRIFEIRKLRANLEEQDKVLKEEFAQIELVLLARADEQGATRISTTDGTATITEEEVPTVTDWDAVHLYIKENDAFHLLQRRINTAAWREMLKAATPLPGTAPFTKRSIGFRSA